MVASEYIRIVDGIGCGKLEVFRPCHLSSGLRIRVTVGFDAAEHIVFVIYQLGGIPALDDKVLHRLPSEVHAAVDVPLTLGRGVIFGSCTRVVVGIARDVYIVRAVLVVRIDPRQHRQSGKYRGSIVQRVERDIRFLISIGSVDTDSCLKVPEQLVVGIDPGSYLLVADTVVDTFIIMV